MRYDPKGSLVQMERTFRFQRILMRCALCGVILTAVLLILYATAPQAHGGDTYAAGEVDSGGYTYSNGFWWMGGRAYERYKYKCCTSSTGWCWGYRLAPYAAGGAGVTVINNLVGIPVPVAYTLPQAQQGSTVYWYSSLTYTPPDQINYSRLYQQAGRLAEQAQALNSEATTGFMQMVQTGSAPQQEAAKTIAQGMAAAAALQAAKPGNPAPVQQQLTFSLRQDPNGGWNLEQGSQTKGGTLKIEGGTQPPQASPQLTQAQADEFKAGLTQGCATCHNGANPKTKLDLRDVGSISDDVAAKMVARITHADPAQKMPPPGSPQLTPRQLKVFFDALVD